MVDWKEKLQKEVVVSEAYLTGLFWNKPEIYNFYSEEKITYSHFMNGAYGYFFTLGRKASEKGFKVFDDISISEIVKLTNTQSQFDKFGGLATIREVQYEVRDKDENLDVYYTEIKKYVMLNKLVALFGERVISQEGKYDYKKMTKDQLHTYWNDKVNQLAMDGDNNYEEEHLLKNLRSRVTNWNNNPSVGLPFYEGDKMTKICTGWDYGHVYMLGGFGGSGKTSLAFSRVVMSCIKNQEKLLIIANEQSTDDFAKLAVISSMGSGTKSSIRRQRFNEGEFTEDEDKKIEAGINYLEELSGKKDELITIIFMENYIMDDVKKIIRHYAARGIRRVMVDTARPSDTSSGADMARWERFVEDFKELYKLARPNGGGLNIAIWANIQLADAALNRRFLSEHALGDSKKIKNEASVLFMFRTIWDDEFTGEKHELKVSRWIPDEFRGGYKEETFTLDRGEQYLLLFTSKNRRGLDNKVGQKVLVIKPNFNNNTYKEIGETTVYDDKNY